MLFITNKSYLKAVYYGPFSISKSSTEAWISCQIKKNGKFFRSYFIGLRWNKWNKYGIAFRIGHGSRGYLTIAINRDW